MQQLRRTIDRALDDTIWPGRARWLTSRPGIEPRHDHGPRNDLAAGVCNCEDGWVKIMRQVVVFDAVDLDAESAFWAGMLGGRVFADERWHSVVDADGRWVIGVQLAPDHVPPEWPDGTPQQVHLDLHVDDPVSAHAEAIGLGARLLQAADDLTATQGHQVYADPAGHPFCLGWGHPNDEAIRSLGA